MNLTAADNATLLLLQVFGVAGALACKSDLKNIEVHLLDRGHFAVETEAAPIGKYLKTFMSSHRQ